VDDIFQNQKFKDAYNNILIFFANKPFLCTQMSASLLAALKRYFPDRSFKIKTGDLLYNNCILFKQNVDLNSLVQKENSVIKAEWDGHCWVELDDRYILDISIFRTVYSDAFTKSCKQEILDTFGFGHGFLVIDKQHPDPSLRYIERSVLHDNIIDGILKAVVECQDQFSN